VNELAKLDLSAFSWTSPRRPGDREALRQVRAPYASDPESRGGGFTMLAPERRGGLVMLSSATATGSSTPSRSEGCATRPGVRGTRRGPFPGSAHPQPRVARSAEPWRGR
jgi:hypothetical protein